MDSAKDMLDAINVDHSGFLGALAKGFISFPVSMGFWPMIFWIQNIVGIIRMINTDLRYLLRE